VPKAVFIPDSARDKIMRMRVIVIFCITVASGLGNPSSGERNKGMFAPVKMPIPASSR